VPADDAQNLLRRTPDAIASRFELDHESALWASILGTFLLFPGFRCAKTGLSAIRWMTMEHTLVRRDQYHITPFGIVHTPTDAAFTPNPGDPNSGIERMGQLLNKNPMEVVSGPTTYCG
jgi:hypothetical protein